MINEYFPMIYGLAIFCKCGAVLGTNWKCLALNSISEERCSGLNSRAPDGQVN